jgi:hypothetical protein
MRQVRVELQLKSPSLQSAAKAGAVAGAINNGAQQVVDVNTGYQSGYDLKGFALSPIKGAITATLLEGTVPKACIPGLSCGQGNLNSLGKAMGTQLSNSTIQAVSISTSLKSAIGSQAANMYKTLGSALFDIGSAKLSQPNHASQSGVGSPVH